MGTQDKRKIRRRRKVHKKHCPDKAVRPRLYVQTAVIAVGILLLAGMTFAWYTWRERAADSKDAEVMEPYYLYLRDETDTQMVRLAVDSVFSGETKKIYFCVSNGPNAESMGSMGGGNFDYTMEIACTENLPLTFRIFELDSFEEGAMAAGTQLNPEADVSDERRKAVFGDIATNSIVNRGKYETYSNGKDGNKLHLSTGIDSNGTETYMSRFFRLEIGCDADSFDKYRKETDVIYLLVRAEQPKPVKQSE